MLLCAPCDAAVSIAGFDMIDMASLFTVILVSLGLVFFLAGVVGLLRFPDPLSRLHALTKADVLGLGLVVIGLLPQVAWPFAALKLILLWVLVVIGGSIAGQLVAASQFDPSDAHPDADPAPSPAATPEASPDTSRVQDPDWLEERMP